MKTIHVLWTGGWDSSFRVLEALLMEDAVVKPYYVVDVKRKSTTFEVAAMAKIRNQFCERYPALAERFLAVEMIHKDEIKPNSEVTEYFQLLASKTRIGSQYDWLARFAHQFQIDALELCIEKFDSDGSRIFGDYIVPLLKGVGHECRVEGPFTEPGMRLFTCFRFPIIHIEKNEMRRIAEKQGFIDLMRLIWFCHHPAKDGKPCGKCRPCQLANGSGMTYEFSKVSLLEKTINFFKS